MPDNAAPLILLTRPRAASDRFAEQIRQEIGHIDIAITPLMRIETRDVALDLDGVSALIFTSTAGVTAFAELSHERSLPAWCVGDRTAEAAQEVGLKASSAQGDADALVGLMIDARPEGRLLHLHGTHVRGAVAERLAAAGLRAEGLAIYRQTALLPDHVFDMAMRHEGALLVPLFSPRSARLFAEAAGPDRTGKRTAVALSPAVAEACPAGIAAQMVTAATPDAPALIRAMQEVICLGRGA